MVDGVVQGSALWFRNLLQGNENVILCEANSSLSIEWLSPNAVALGATSRGSVLSLVAPESRGLVSRAIFRAARENTTRVRVRAFGRDADLVVVADNDYLRSRKEDDDPRLSRASGSSYAIGLFMFESCGARLAEEWSEASCAAARRVGRELAAHGELCSLVAVDARGVVVDFVGSAAKKLGLVKHVSSPLEVVAEGERQRVAKGFANRVKCQIHKCSGIDALALSSCASIEDDNTVIFLYVAPHRTTLEGFDKREQAPKKRKRTASKFFDEAAHVPPAATYRRSQSSSSSFSSEGGTMRRPRGDDEDDWGHFVFPDGEPEFNLPPVPRVTQRSHRAAACREASDDSSSEILADASQDEEDDPVVINIDTLLPSPQSIENYERALAAMGPAPAVRYSALALDSLLTAVLPRPESIADFRASMIEIRNKSTQTQDERDDAADSTSFARKGRYAATTGVTTSFSRLCFPVGNTEPDFRATSSDAHKTLPVKPQRRVNLVG